MASRFASSMRPVTSTLPDPARHAANDSIGSALVAAQQVGGQTGAELADAARAAYVDGFGLALVVAAGVALAGAVIAAIWLPARATDLDTADADDASDAAIPLHGDMPRIRGVHTGDGRTSGIPTLRVVGAPSPVPDEPSVRQDQEDTVPTMAR
jgi:hypothetical protein